MKKSVLIAVAIAAGMVSCTSNQPLDTQYEYAMGENNVLKVESNITPLIVPNSSRGINASGDNFANNTQIGLIGSNNSTSQKVYYTIGGSTIYWNSFAKLVQNHNASFKLSAVFLY